MKNPILIFAVAGMVYLSSCGKDSPQRGVDTTYSDSLELQRDDAVNNQNAAGISGSQDTLDTMGTQDTLGTQDNQDTLGTQGMQGVQGAQGTEGMQGTQDTLGSQGTRDTQGTQGTPSTQRIVAGTIGTQGQISQGWANVPQRIRDQVERDNSLRNRNIRQSRSYLQDGRTYYELTFDGNENQKVVYDELGNRMNNNN